MRNALFLMLSLRVAHALFAEEAGELDFVVASAGHGPVVTAGADDANTLIVTSDGDFDTYGDSCYLAARSLQDGKLLWRRHVCTDAAAGYRVAVSSSNVATVDRAGVLQMWDVTTGSLLWDEHVAAAEPMVWFPENLDGVVAVGEKASNIITLDAATGQPTKAGGGSVFGSKPDSKSLGVKLEEICPDNKASVSFSKSEGFSSSFASDFAVPNQDAVKLLLTMSCSSEAASFLVATERGTTLLLEVTGGKGSVKWTTEEGLGMIDAAIFMDASSAVSDVDQTHGEDLLTFPSRLESQVKDIVNLFSGASSGHGRDQFFGFVKVAVLLSSKVNRLFGMDTISDTRSSLRYSIDLPNAKWHKIIRGSTNALSSKHGIGGGTHARDILVVSYNEEDKAMHWKCVDGTTGIEAGSSSVKLSAPVAQILPLHSHSVCRQSAALILQDKSVVFVPDNEATKLDILQHLRNAPNGFYSHTVNKEKGTIESLLVDPQESAAQVISMGTTTFPGEKIVTVAYPNREEIIQSPCNALGDQSLLLKYINPHLFVVVTASDSPTVDTYNALMKTNKDQKRKPTGATPSNGSEPASATAGEVRPNLFINVIDSVSGRVIHRASHASAALQPPPSVVISENWIIYTFANERTRRAEIGVLSLYEGMIDSKGLTAFSTPERTTEFSSVDAKETKPVVLAKTYSMVKGITAIGMSSTGGGISGRRLLVATLSGQIFGVDRRMLEPRRPVSELKDSEKKEGLRQYDELIPAVSLMSLSHSEIVEGVKGIVTAPTDLESQTLVLAYGGPDIFYARTSPSRGFDLLPESFSRVLLSIVVAALVIVVFVIQSRVSKKIKKQGWV